MLKNATTIMNIKLATILILIQVFVLLEGRVININKQLDVGEAISDSITFRTPDDAVVGSENPMLNITQLDKLQEGVDILFFLSQYQDCVSTVRFEGSERVDRCKSIDKLCSQEHPNCCNYVQHITTSFFSEDLYSIKINNSGRYILEYVNCNSASVKIDAQITYINPFGQLSAETYPLLWFFGILTGFIVIVLIVWIVFLIIYRENLISLQFFLLILLTFELFESFSWFLLFVAMNSTGSVYWLWLLIAVLTSSIKRTFVGLLILLISLGYGIMNKAKIHENKRLIIFVIGFYFFVSTCQELVTAFLREGVIADQALFLNFASLVLLFPAVLVPLGLFWWICSCLIKTIQKLKLRKQEVKLEFYNKLFLSLLVAGTVTCLVIILQTSISVIDTDTVWQVWWIFTAYWFMLFLSLTLALLYFLHPSVNKELLAYTKHDLNSSGDEFDISGGDVEMTDIDTLNFDFDLGLDNLEEEVSKNL